LGACADVENEDLLRLRAGYSKLWKGRSWMTRMEKLIKHLEHSVQDTEKLECGEILEPAVFIGYVCLQCIIHDISTLVEEPIYLQPSS
jgi:hypothetical protein